MSMGESRRPGASRESREEDETDRRSPSQGYCPNWSTSLPSTDAGADSTAWMVIAACAEGRCCLEDDLEDDERDDDDDRDEEEREDELREEDDREEDDREEVDREEDDREEDDREEDDREYDLDDDREYDREYDLDDDDRE